MMLLSRDRRGDEDTGEVQCMECGCWRYPEELYNGLCRDCEADILARIEDAKPVGPEKIGEKTKEVTA